MPGASEYITPTVRYRVPSTRRHDAIGGISVGATKTNPAALQKAFDDAAQEQAALARCRDTIAVIRGHARWCQQTGLPVLLAALCCAFAGMILPALAVALAGYQQ